MKKIVSVIVLSLLLCGFTNADVTTTTSSNSCDIQIQAWEGNLNGHVVYFSSYACAKNAGATNIQYAGFRSHCSVFVCI